MTINYILELAKQNMARVPNHYSYFTYIKGDHSHIGIASDIKILDVNNVNPSLEITRLYFYLNLEKYNTVMIEPSKNVFASLMNSQRKVGYYKFNKYARGYHKVKKYLILLFEWEDVLEVPSN